MYECKLCHHRATHPAFLRCQRCFQQRQDMRGQSRSFTPSPTPSADYSPDFMQSMSFAALAGSSSPSYSGGGGSFDGGGASASWGSSSSDSGSSSSSSCSDSSSSSSSDSGSSSCSTD